MLYFTLAVSGAAALAYLLVWCFRTSSLAKTVVKTVSVGALAFAAMLLEAPILLITALALGALGDFFLSRDGDRAFLFGLIVFAIAHLSYVALFIQQGAMPSLSMGAALLSVFAVIYAAILFQHAGELRWPVVCYVAIIAVMSICALNSITFIGMVAAFFFILSDTILGAQIFLMSEKSRLNFAPSVLIWGTYWTAQLLFLLAFAPAIFG